jgi:hypothetical protein
MRRRWMQRAVVAILISEVFLGAAMVLTFDVHPQLSSKLIFHSWILDGRLGLEVHHDRIGLTLNQHLDSFGLKAHYPQHLVRDRYQSIKPWFDWSIERTASEEMYFVAFPLWLPLPALIALAARFWWLDSRRMPIWICKHCDYRFPGLEPGRCPECGRSVGRSFIRFYRSLRR